MASVAPEAQHTHPPVHGGQGQPARHPSSTLADPIEGWRKGSIGRDRNHRRSLCGPDGAGRSHRGDRQPSERRRWRIGGLEHHQPHFVCRIVVQNKGEVVERNNRVQMVGEHAEQLGDRAMTRKTARDAEQRLVPRKRVEERRTARTFFTGLDVPLASSPALCRIGSCRPAGSFGVWRSESDGRLWPVKCLQVMDLRNSENRAHLWYIACLSSRQYGRTSTG